MDKYKDKLSKKISNIWSIEKTREELKYELHQLLILLPLGDLIEINKTITTKNKN